MRLAFLGLMLASVVLAPALHAAPLERLKTLYPATPLWVGGQPRALLVAPESLGDARDREGASGNRSGREGGGQQQSVAFR